MKWRDETSYRRGERGTVEPRAWQLDGCPFRVTIHHKFGLGDVWFLSAYDIGTEDAQLAATDASCAQVAAVAFVRARLKALASAFEKAVAEPCASQDQEKTT